MKNYILGVLVLLASLQFKTHGFRWYGPQSNQPITAECKENLVGSNLHLTCEAGQNNSCVYTKTIPSSITKLSLYAQSGSMVIKSMIPSTVTQITLSTTYDSTISLPPVLPTTHVINLSLEWDYDGD